MGGVEGEGHPPSSWEERAPRAMPLPSPMVGEEGGRQAFHLDLAWRHLDLSRSKLLPLGSRWTQRDSCSNALLPPSPHLDLSGRALIQALPSIPSPLPPFPTLTLGLWGAIVAYMGWERGGEGEE